VKIYLTGPIGSGPDRETNVERFHEVARRLRNISTAEIVSPVELDHKPEDDWTDYLKRDIKAMLDCDAIYCLTGWERSPGARLEVFIALQLGLQRMQE
jgi:Domain of unknown function (DUF4406)